MSRIPQLLLRALWHSMPLRSCLTTWTTAVPLRAPRLHLPPRPGWRILRPQLGPGLRPPRPRGKGFAQHRSRSAWTSLSLPFVWTWLSRLGHGACWPVLAGTCRFGVAPFRLRACIQLLPWPWRILADGMAGRSEDGTSIQTARPIPAELGGASCSLPGVWTARSPWRQWHLAMRHPRAPERGTRGRAPTTLQRSRQPCGHWRSSGIRCMKGWSTSGCAMTTSWWATP